MYFHVLPGQTICKYCLYKNENRNVCLKYFRQTDSKRRCMAFKHHNGNLLNEGLNIR